MSKHITGKLITVGNYTEDEQVDRDSPLARAVVVMPREALKAVRSLPMYEDVLIVTTEEWDQLRAENAALREDKARREESLASFYPAVAPVVEHFPVGLWEHMGQGRCRGTWAEDGSPYYFTVPHQLVPAFFALQRLAKLAEEKHAERKEAQP